MKLRYTSSALAMVVVLAISACSKSEDSNAVPKTDQPVGNNYPKPQNAQEVSSLLSTAIKSFKSSIFLDVSAMGVADSQVEITIKNAYQSALTQDNSLKYAYNLVLIYNTTAKVVQCEIKYMPFKLGIDANTVPAGTKKVNSYNELITAVSNSPLGQDIPIAITNKNLDFDIMQSVLTSQCGYCYLVYTFNADATTIKCSPAPTGLPGAPTSMSDCVSKITRLRDSVDKILPRIITQSMTNDQKFDAIYKYVASTITYDFTYNTPNMPFDSQSAFGVFVNKKAVCGGYSWGVNMLANAAGIQCYNVGGIAYPDTNPIGHAWTRANYNGGYYYFDCTWDDGLSTYRYFAKTEQEFKALLHSWDNKMINALVAEKQ